MTDLETAIMIKNMARETVRQMTAKNAVYFVEYVKGGINKLKDFYTYDEAEAWAESAGLKRSKDPEEENEYRIVRQ